MALTDKVTPEVIYEQAYEDPYVQDWIETALVPVTEIASKELLRWDELTDLSPIAEDVEALKTRRDIVRHLTEASEFAQEVVDIFRSLNVVAEKAIAKAGAEFGLTAAEGEAIMVNDLIRSYVVRTLPMFQAYVCAVTENLADHAQES